MAIDRRFTATRPVFSAFFLALAIILPFLTASSVQLGAIFCLMHLPVMLCGFFCGPYWGLAVGFSAPIFRSFLIGMPPLFPNAIAMALELAAYGFFCGLFFRLMRKKPFGVVASLLLSMLCGRGVLGLTNALIYRLFLKTPYTVDVFLTAAFVTPWPGILLQVLFVPPIVLIAQRKFQL